MTDDELALLRTIREYPDADLPRLVYADWLEERGDAERAEFIRLQIDRYRRIPADPSARGLGWREYEILLEHELAWKAELPPGFRTGATFRRGLIHRAQCRVRDLFAATEAELAAPIEQLSVTVDELNLEWLSAPPPAFRLPLRELALHCTTPVGPYLAEALVRYGPFPRLHTLRIHDREFGVSGVVALTRWQAFPALTHLDLSACGLTDSFAGVVLDWEPIEHLHRLTISGNAFEHDIPDFLRSHHPHLLID